ncbi:MAG TPA: hypothetical protein VMI56_17190 [Reyranella sp.]|nr:hypothetical protein [Reyranella sp.]
MDDREIYLMPRVAEADFPRLREIMKAEEDFPAEYTAWLSLWARRRREEEQDHGYRVVFVDVPPAGFERYCLDRKAEPSWAWLGRYIAELAGRQ